MTPNDYPLLWANIVLSDEVYTQQLTNQALPTDNQELQDLKQQLSVLIENNPLDFEAMFLYMVASRLMKHDDGVHEYIARYSQSNYATFEFLNVNINQ